MLTWGYSRQSFTAKVRLEKVHTAKEFQKEEKSCGWCGKTPAHSLNNCAAQVAENAIRKDMPLYAEQVEWMQFMSQMWKLFSWEQCLQVRIMEKD